MWNRGAPNVQNVAIGQGDGVFTTAPTWIGSPDGPALDFNGSSDSVNYGVANGLLLGVATEMSVLVRVKLPVLTADQRLAARWGADAKAFILWMDTGGSDGYAFFVRGVGGDSVVGDAEATAVANKWQTVVGNFKAGVETSVWTDGIKGDSEVPSTTSLQNDVSEPIFLGEFNASSFMQGSCSLFIVRNKAFTDNQIRQISADPFGPFRMVDETGVVFAVVLSTEFTSANLTLNHSGASDIGGAIAAVLTDDALNNIWDDVSSGDASAGDTEYRCSYVKNTHASLSVANVFVDIGTDPAESNFEISLGAAGLNGTETEIADEDTAPAGTSFGTGRIDMGTLAAGDSFPFWIKRIVAGGAGAATPDSGVVNICGDDPN